VLLRDALQAELTAAMRRRDRATADACRTALAALANAEAAPIEAAPGSPTATSPHIAGAIVGLGAGEVARVALDEDATRSLVRHERAALLDHAERLVRLCRLDEADAARRGAEALGRALDSSS
jgi:hypothetical protein